MNYLVTVEQAEKIILDQCKDFSVEEIDFSNALGRVLASAVLTDRPLPPFDRVTMDGIAVQSLAVKTGIRTFRIKGLQAAGDTPIRIDHLEECVEIMTGANLPEVADAVIPYELLNIYDAKACIKEGVEVVSGQNIHKKGKDKGRHEVIIQPDRFITPAMINTIAAVGKMNVKVKKCPSVVIITTGNELVDIYTLPSDSQIRRSSNYALDAELKNYGIQAEMVHLPDDRCIIKEFLATCIERYDAILLTGGVSMGKFDYVPETLEELAVKKLFHKISQRPGKPFWFGIHPDGARVFAFPGNPISTFMCFHRYFIPWLLRSWSIKTEKRYAILDRDISFVEPLTYFMQVKLTLNEKAQLLASPLIGNGSGDFAGLSQADAFMEIPQDRDSFKSGDLLQIWSFNYFVKC